MRHYDINTDTQTSLFLSIKMAPAFRVSASSESSIPTSAHALHLKKLRKIHEARVQSKEERTQNGLTSFGKFVAGVSAVSILALICEFFIIKNIERFRFPREKFFQDEEEGEVTEDQLIDDALAMAAGGVRRTRRMKRSLDDDEIEAIVQSITWGDKDEWGQ